jgi:hypothetical protein
LAFKSNSDINEIVVSEYRKIKDEYETNEIALPISVHEIDSYTANLPVHIRGAKIWNQYYAKSDLDKINSGKVKYIYVKEWDKQELNVNQEYVISIPDTPSNWNFMKDKIKVDYDKMVERLLIKPVGIFYDAMKWELPKEITCKNNGVLLNASRKKIKRKIKLI